MNKTSAIAVIVALVIGIVIGLMLRLQSCGGGTVSHSDTVTAYVTRTDTAYKTIETKVPVPYKVVVYHFRDTTKMVSHSNNSNNSTLSISEGLKDSNLQKAQSAETTGVISYYSDSLRMKDEFKAVITDTVDGKILGRSVKWADLTPIEKVVITNTVVKNGALIKGFIGVGVSIPTRSVVMSGADFVPGAALLIKDRYLISADYGVFHGTATVGLKIKLQFHK